MALIDSPRWRAMPPMADAPAMAMASHISLLRTVLGMSPPAVFMSARPGRSVRPAGGLFRPANDSSKPAAGHLAPRRERGGARCPAAGKRGAQWYNSPPCARHKTSISLPAHVSFEPDHPGIRRRPLAGHAVGA